MRSRRSRCAVMAVVVGALAACQSGGRDAATSTSTTTTAPTATAAAAPTAPGCAPFRGASDKLESVGRVAAGLLTDAVAGAVGCLDQVTFTFAPLGEGTPPGYVVEYQDPAQTPFLDGDPPGPISLPGNAFLRVTMKPASSSNPLLPDRPQTYLGNLSLRYGEHHHLEIVRKLPDADNSVVWVIGLDGKRPFLVDRAENPTRITVYIG